MFDVTIAMFDKSKLPSMKENQKVMVAEYGRVFPSKTLRNVPAFARAFAQAYARANAQAKEKGVG